MRIGSNLNPCNHNNEFIHYIDFYHNGRGRSIHPYGMLNVLKYSGESISSRLNRINTWLQGHPIGIDMKLLSFNKEQITLKNGRIENVYHLIISWKSHKKHLYSRIGGYSQSMPPTPIGISYAGTECYLMDPMYYTTIYMFPDGMYPAIDDAWISSIHQNAFIHGSDKSFVEN